MLKIPNKKTDAVAPLIPRFYVLIESPQAWWGMKDDLEIFHQNTQVWDWKGKGKWKDSSRVGFRYPPCHVDH